MSNKTANTRGKQNFSNEEELVINTGTRRYTVKDEHGRLMGTLFWNPADTGILERYNEVVAYFDSIVVPEDGTEQFIIDTNKGIVEKLSYMLNEDTSESLFSKVAPLSILANGNVFVYELLEKIAMLVEKESKVRVKRANTKINKYTQRYHK